jgi:exonuclease SbcC
LFIDEGFSALDQETLDVALSAFDALRQTGRQIGVISHVPLLVERIGAQVRVVPIGGGASRVEIDAA